MTDNADTITSRDLPQLRAAMLGYAADEVFSDGFHAACRAVVAAIDQTRVDDESTHEALRVSMQAFVAAGNQEAARCARIIQLTQRFDAATAPEDIRDALVELLPLLPPRKLLSALAAFAAYPGAIDAALSPVAPQNVDAAHLCSASGFLH